MKARTGWTVAVAAAAMAALLAGAASVRAGTLYVDFGSYNGSATGLRDGGLATWNIMRNDSGRNPIDNNKYNLVDESGKATAIDISAWTGFVQIRSGTWDGSPPPPNWCVAAATTDAYKGDNTDPTVTFSDLTAGTEYTFEIASTAEGTGGGYDQDFRLVGLTATSWINYHGYTHAVQGNETRTLGPVKPDANGKIVLEIRRSGSAPRFTFLAAVKLTWPEPPKGTVFLLK